MNMNVYRAGAIVSSIPIDERATLKRNITGIDEISMDIVQLNGILPVQIGDYIVFEGRNYYLNRPAGIEKKSAVEFQFSLTFEADIYTLLNKLYQQPVTGRGDFSLVDDLDGFVDVLLSNINSTESGWTKGAIPQTERKLMTFDGENCRAVLNRLADEFDVEFCVIGKQIAFYGIYENATSLTFEHGQGKGLYELSRDNVDSNNTVTRGWFWGASKNIDYTYRDGETRLIFTNPATGTNRIDNFGDFSQAVEKQIIFEDVWPQFTGAITAVNNNVGAGLHTIVCPLIDFDVTLQMIEGVAPKVFFKSGDLQAQEFEIKAYDHASRTITLITYTDEFGQVWPNTSFYPRVGDLFTFLDLKMPDAYVAAAENTLAVKAAEWMDYYSKLRVKYSLDLDPRYLRNNAITLHLGDVVGIVDTELSINKQIRITSIEKNIENPYKVKCEISNILEERWEKKISKQVLEALNNSKTATEKVSSTTMAIGSFFGRYFEVRGTAGNEYICAKMPFASVGEITAYTSGAALPSMWDSMPLASATVKGGIKIGTGFTYVDGVLSVAAQTASQTLSFASNILSISGGNSVSLASLTPDLSGYAVAGHTHTAAQVGLGNVGNYSDYARKGVAEVVTGAWTYNNNIEITPKDASWAEGLMFYMPTTQRWGGLRWQRGRANNDGNWAIGFTGLDATDDLVFCAQNGNTQIDNILRISKDGRIGIGRVNDNATKNQIKGSTAIGQFTNSTAVIDAYDGVAYFGCNTASNGMHIDANGYAHFNVIYSNYNNAVRLGVTKTNASSPDGISLWNSYEASVDGMPNYGMFFGITSTFGTHGYVNGYAIYNTMSGSGSWGWIYRNKINNTNVLSISADGNLYTNGTLNAAQDVVAGGNITATGEVTAYSSSDRRLKTNIKTITNASDVLRKLRAVEFDWNETAMCLNPAKRDAPHSVSFIAQEWEKVLPWATHSIFGKYKSIDKDVTTGYLVAGWNEHDKKLTTHDKEINQLRQRVSELEKQLNKP